MSRKLLATFLFLLIFTACSRAPAPEAPLDVAEAVVTLEPVAPEAAATEPPAAMEPSPTAEPPAATESSPTATPPTTPATTMPTATTRAPLSLSLLAEPETIIAGDCTILTWEVAGAAAVWLYAATESFAQNTAPHAGSEEFCPGATTTYELRAQAAAGPPQVEQVVVTVQGGAEAEQPATAQSAATAGAVAPAIQGANPLGGTIWQVSAVDGAPVIPGTVVAVLFGRDGSINVNGGCNTLIGSYQAGGEAVAIAALPVPTLTCGDSLMAQEQALVAALQAAVALEQVEGQLVFRDAAGAETVRFGQP